MFNPRRNRKGFTIIELIVVIAIIAILAAIAIPMFVGLTDRANTAVAQADARSIATAINAYNAMHTSGSQITSLAGVDEASLSATLTGLYPEGVQDYAAAVALISFSNGIAVVNTGGAGGGGGEE